MLERLIAFPTAGRDGQKALLAQLGKHKMGKACLYFKKLFDLDKSVLKQLIANSIDELKRRFG